MMSWWHHSPLRSDPFVQANPVWPVHLTRSEPPTQKKEKKKKKRLWPSLNFDLGQKVKIFKMGLSQLVFQVHSNFGIRFFIRDLESVQMAQFLKSWLLHESWPKVIIFKTGLSHLVFRVHSDFGICFFVWDSEILQTVQFPESWLLHKSGPKVQNFQEGLVLPNFSCRFWFWSLFLH